MHKNERGHYLMAQLFGLLMFIGSFGLIAWVVAHFFKVPFDEAFKGILGGLFLLIITAMVVMRTIECLKKLIKKI